MTPFRFVTDYSERLKSLAPDIFLSARKLGNLETTAGVALLSALLLPSYDRVLRDKSQPKDNVEAKLSQLFIEGYATQPIPSWSSYDANHTLRRINRITWAPIREAIANVEAVRLSYRDVLSTVRNAIAHGHVFYLCEDKSDTPDRDTAGVAFVRNEGGHTFVSILSNESLRKLFDEIAGFLSRDVC